MNLQNTQLVPLYPFLSPVSWGWGGDGTLYLCSFPHFNNLSLNKPAIRGNLQMRLTLTENIQLTLCLKVPEIYNEFKIADNLLTARVSPLLTSTTFPWAAHVEALGPSRNHSHCCQDQVSNTQRRREQFHCTNLYFTSHRGTQKEEKRSGLQLRLLMFHETSHVLPTTERINKNRKKSENRALPLCSLS